MRIHNPIFPEDSALFIIWHEEPRMKRYSLAAGTFTAVNAAWNALQDEYPRATLEMQQGVRIMRIREPIKAGGGS